MQFALAHVDSRTSRRRGKAHQRGIAIESLEHRVLMASAYDWQSAQIGGGGFVTSVLFSPLQQGLVYARTDVGGAYRWDAGAGRWTALNDFQPSSENNSAGVESIAIDPEDVNKFYMTCGTYGLTATWGPMGILYRSSDQGRSFARIALPFKVAGNNEGRGSGERLVVDPHNSNILYYGSRSWMRNSDGATIPAQLWKSTDGGNTWSVVNSFTGVASSNATGFAFLDFDKNTYNANGMQVVYAGLSQLGSTAANLYRSTDGGATWSPITGTGSTPGVSFMPIRESLTPDGSTMYLTYGSGPGPSDDTSGGVWKLATATNVWTKITPTSTSQAATAGYGGVCVDPEAPNTVVVSTPDMWTPQNLVFRSTDGGATWRDLRTNAVLDASSAPYAAGVNPHWCSDIVIDPFNRNHAIVNTGYGLWSLNDMTTTDNSGSTQPVNHWSFNSQNLEETVVNTVISPSVGPHLLNVHGDYDGFVIADPSTNSAAGAVRYSPAIGSESQLDFAQNAAATIVRGGGASPYGYVSINSGSTWTAFANRPTNVTGIGSVVLSADGSHIIWSPTFSSSPGIYYSTDGGQHWTKSTAPITGGTLVADRANASKIYLYSGSNLYVSTNGGATFGNAIGAGRTISGLVALPGIEGDLWMSSSGLYHSTNSGTTWTRVASTITSVGCVGFGKAAPGKSYPAMYLYGSMSGANNQIYESDDTGTTWTRINDDAHQYCGSLVDITGDPRIYGRVYLASAGAGGRGTLYADLYSGLPSGWSYSDIGSPAIAGMAAIGADPSVPNWISKAGGTGIGGTSDQFTFIREPFAGDATAIVRVKRVDNSSNGAVAGIMFRDSTAASAIYAMIGVTAGNGLVFSDRATTGGTATTTTYAGPSWASWLKMVRTGNTFTAYYATTSTTPGASDWIAIGTPQTVTMSSAALAGLATCSNNSAIATTAMYSDISILPPAPANVSFQVNDGSIQRSMVASLTLTFDQPVTLGTGAITLSLRNGSSVAFGTSITNPLGDGKTYLLTFSGTGIVGNSVPDGGYTVTVKSALVSDAYGQTLSGGDRKFRFFRLFGDADGNRMVNGADLALFRQALGNPGTNNAIFDYNGNSVVDASDYLQIRLRVIRSLI